MIGGENMIYQCVDCGKRYTKKYESCPNCNTGVLIAEDLVAKEHTKDTKPNTAPVHQAHKVIKQKHFEPMVCDTCGGTEWTYHKAGLNIRGAIRKIWFGIFLGIMTFLVAVIGGMIGVGLEHLSDALSEGVGAIWICIVLALAVWQFIIFVYVVPKTLIKNHGNVYKICASCGEAYKLHDNINGYLTGTNDYHNGYFGDLCMTFNDIHGQLMLRTD